MKSEINEIIDLIKKFRDDRDWAKFHDAKNLAICLNVESAELLLWKNENEVNSEKVKEELADVLYSAFLLSDKYGFNVSEIIKNKIEINERKYPIEKAKGTNKKYDEF
jgi:NTP pyrophosphatase (non-canonical NTP hydrolase)